MYIPDGLGVMPNCLSIPLKHMPQTQWLASLPIPSRLHSTFQHDPIGRSTEPSPSRCWSSVRSVTSHMLKPFCKLFQNDTKFAAALRLCGGALPDPPSMSHNVHILSLRIIAAWEQPVLTLASCAKPRLVLRMTHPRRWMK